MSTQKVPLVGGSKTKRRVNPIRYGEAEFLRAAAGFRALDPEAYAHAIQRLASKLSTPEEMHLERNRKLAGLLRNHQAGAIFDRVIENIEEQRHRDEAADTTE